MELGLTWPLQRFLKCAPPPPGEADRFFCWDLHRITLQGQPCLLAVHAQSRYTLIRCMTPAEWGDLSGILAEEIRAAFVREGFGENAAKACLYQAGPACFSRTHGRREVAFLNRAWDDAAALSGLLLPGEQSQPLLCDELAGVPCRCAGFAEKAPARVHLARALAEKHLL